MRARESAIGRKAREKRKEERKKERCDCALRTAAKISVEALFAQPVLNEVFACVRRVLGAEVSV